MPNIGLGALEIKWLNFTIVLGEWVTRAAEKGEWYGRHIDVIRNYDGYNNAHYIDDFGNYVGNW